MILQALFRKMTPDPNKRIAFDEFMLRGRLQIFSGFTERILNTDNANTLLELLSKWCQVIEERFATKYPIYIYQVLKTKLSKEIILNLCKRINEAEEDSLLLDRDECYLITAMVILLHGFKAVASLTKQELTPEVTLWFMYSERDAEIVMDAYSDSFSFDDNETTIFIRNFIIYPKPSRQMTDVISGGQKE